jgi:poly(A) polymerase Pap1
MLRNSDRPRHAIYFKVLVKLWEIIWGGKKRKAKYHPECDGLSERKIRQVKHKLRISYQILGPKTFGQKLKKVTECINDERTRGLQATPLVAKKIFEEQRETEKARLIEGLKEYNKRTAKYTNKKESKTKGQRHGTVQKQRNKKYAFTETVINGPF